MTQRGIFQKFMQVLRRRFRASYPFVQPLKQSLDLSIPKSSSFYLGVSPKYNRHVVVNFQHSPKPWEVGQFTVNVHISQELRLTENYTPQDGDWEAFRDGYHRLYVAGRGKWWCLKPPESSEPSESSRYTEHWRPPSYDSEEVTIQAVLDDVCCTLDEEVFERGGFINKVGA